MLVTDKYVFFYGNQEPFSNHYFSQFSDGVHIFNCTEQYMMFHKAELFGDKEIAEEILKERSPSVQKRLGRRIKGFDEHIWDLHKESIVYDGCKLKFKGTRLEKELLKHKGKTFVEASGYDTIWGVGLTERDPKILNPSNWRGQNLLGNILTKLSLEL